MPPNNRRDVRVFQRSGNLLLAFAVAVTFKVSAAPQGEGIVPVFGNGTPVVGEPALTRRFLEIFRRDFPCSSDLFSVELSLAARRKEEARSRLLAIAADPRHPDRFAALELLAGEAYKAKNFFGAFCFFRLLDRPGAPAAQRVRGRTGQIFCLMNAGAAEETLALLKDAGVLFPEEALLWKKLNVWALGRSGDAAALVSYWAANEKDLPPSSDPILFEGLYAGSAAMESKGMFAQAERFRARAYDYADSNAKRRQCLKSLLALQKDRFPAHALKTVTWYLRFFPDSADRGDILLVQAEVLNRTGNFREALNVAYELLNDGSCAPGIRAEAALQGAFAAEKLADLSLARELYNSAIRRLTPGTPEAGQAKMRLLEFFLRTSEFAPAAVLGEELSGVAGVDQEQLNLHRLLALTKLKRYADAAVMAEKLAGAKDPLRAAEGAWQLARLAELQGKMPEARKQYLKFVQTFPGEKRAPDAVLAAAGIALREKNFPAAAAEFAGFIEKYPRRSDLKDALWAGLYAQLRLGTPIHEALANKMLARLEKDFSGTPEFEKGVLETARFRFDRGNYAKALELLEHFLKIRPESAVAPEALLLSLRIFEKTGDHAGTVSCADRILDKFPGSSAAVGAALSGGGACFRNGDYARALKYYERAGELGGGGVVSLAAAGEAADCHLLLGKSENLAAARKIYRALADKTEFPALRAQALYKLGLACEYSSMNRQALDAYEELLQLAASSEKVRRSTGADAWCARAARSALRIILGTRDMPDGSQRAQRIHLLYSRLEIPGSAGELSRYLSEIQKHYNLLD